MKGFQELPEQLDGVLDDTKRGSFSDNQVSQPRDSPENESEYLTNMYPNM